MCNHSEGSRPFFSVLLQNGKTVVFNQISYTNVSFSNFLISTLLLINTSTVYKNPHFLQSTSCAVDLRAIFPRKRLSLRLVEICTHAVNYSTGFVSSSFDLSLIPIFLFVCFHLLYLSLLLPAFFHHSPK